MSDFTMHQAQPHSSDRISRGSYRTNRQSSKVSSLTTPTSKANEQRSRSISRNCRSIKSPFTKTNGDEGCVFVAIGASTDTIRMKVYPSLWHLFKSGHLPKNIHMYAFSRSPMTKQELREKCEFYMEVKEDERSAYEEFWKANNNFVGSYLARIDYDMLHKELTNSEASNSTTNRLFYIAIPNTFLESVAQNIRTLPQSKRGWTRVITEKPFGKDITTSNKVTQQLLSLCTEEELFRIDTCLCQAIVQNILTIRFCNLLFSSTWNRRMIENVVITLKDTANKSAKEKSSDSLGIICDVVQLQGLQLLALTAMEKPISIKADDVREEKVKLLKNIAPVTMENVVLGQAVEQGKPIKPCESRSSHYETDPMETPRSGHVYTFCSMVVRINNERWDGVPFVLVCGNHTDERKSEIRIRYQTAPADVFKTRTKRNELVIQLEPEERIFLTAVTKVESPEDQEIEIPLTEKGGYGFEKTPNIYEAILKDALSGTQNNFIGSAELKQAWRIFTPLINKIEKENIQPIKYNAGTAGPAESERLIKKHINVDDNAEIKPKTISS